MENWDSMEGDYIAFREMKTGEENKLKGKKIEDLLPTNAIVAHKS